MTIDNYKVVWHHTTNILSKSTLDKSQGSRTITQCIVTITTPVVIVDKAIPIIFDSPPALLKKEEIQYHTEICCTAIFITDPEYQFNRKYAILESFKIAVGQIKERIERTKLWNKFWDIRKKKTIQAILVDNREEKLIPFLEKHTERDIKGEFIVYSLKGVEVDVHFKR